MTKMSALVKHIRPTDFPRTEAKTAFAIKEALARQFNYARQHPKQMEALKAQLQFMTQKTAEWDKAYDALKLEAAAAGKPLEDTPMKFIMTGGGARNVQAQRAVTVKADNSVHTPKLVVSSDKQPTGTSVPAFVSPVVPQPAATVNNSLGHGFIRVGMDSGNTAVDVKGVERSTEQVHTPKVEQANAAGVQTVEVPVQAPALNTLAQAPAMVQTAVPLPLPGVQLPPPIG